MPNSQFHSPVWGWKSKTNLTRSSGQMLCWKCFEILGLLSFIAAKSPCLLLSTTPFELVPASLLKRCSVPSTYRPNLILFVFAFFFPLPRFVFLCLLNASEQINQIRTRASGRTGTNPLAEASTLESDLSCSMDLKGCLLSLSLLLNRLVDRSTVCLTPPKIHHGRLNRPPDEGQRLSAKQ